jgi:hypothetical protein
MIEHHPEVLLEVSEATINDKSSSNSLAKILACIQATWFCINCLIRISQGLSISLLEINTAAHALCALVVYLFWWNKPQNIAEPLQVGSNDAVRNSYISAIALTDYLSRGGDENGPTNPSKTVYQLKWLPQNTPTGSRHWRSRRFTKADLSTAYESASKLQPSVKPGFTRLLCGEVLHGYYIDTIDVGIMKTDSIKWSRFDPYQERDFAQINQPYVDFTETPLKWLQNARKSEIQFPHMQLFSRGDLDQLGLRIEKTISYQAVHLLPRNVLVVAILVASLLYGAIHVVAWNNLSLSNHVASLMWKVSSISVMACGVVLPTCFFIYFLPMVRNRYKHWIRAAEASGILISMFYFLLCRLCLIAESYYTLAHLPVSAYKQPVWSQYVPHFS